MQDSSELGLDRRKRSMNVSCFSNYYYDHHNNY